MVGLAKQAQNKEPRTMQKIINTIEITPHARITVSQVSSQMQTRYRVHLVADINDDHFTEYLGTVFYAETADGAELYEARPFIGPRFTATTLDLATSYLVVAMAKSPGMCPTL